MKLTVSERFAISEILPLKADGETMILTHNILQKVKLIPQEKQVVRFNQTPNVIEVDEETNFERDFEFEPNELDLLIGGALHTEKQGAISRNATTLWVKLRDLAIERNKAAEKRKDEAMERIKDDSVPSSDKSPNKQKPPSDSNRKKN